MNNKAISKVYLLSVPLEDDYKNTLYFDSKENQITYFKSKIVHTFTDTSETAYFSYIRKDNVIKVNKHIDTLWNVNYVMYQNPAYSDKWFYAFIKDMKYENDGCTSIEIETDVMQTWAFDYNIKESFVEREHVSDDSIGLHTLPEGLETGEYICNSKDTIESGLHCYVVATTRDPYNEFRKVGGKIYNGIYSGVKYFALWTTADLETFIESFDEGYMDDITAIFVIPTSLIGGRTYDAENPVYKIPESVTHSDCGSITISRPNSIDGYTPNNKKLLAAPYQYLLVDNSAGSSTEFYYEMFNNPNACKMNIKGSICPGTSRILIPESYAHGNTNGVIGDMINYSLSLGKFPTCNWVGDTYTNWMTQNSVNNAVGFASAGLNMIGGIGTLATGNIAGGLTGVANSSLQIAGQMGTIYQHSFSPMQTKGNINCGDIITSLHANTPIFYKMSIKKEYAKIIDKYFDMFGYKVNMVKVPNKAHRTRYWYTKTIDINIDGAIPMKDIQKIKDCYNKGITFWRNASEIQNYSLSNNIV